MAVRSTSRRSLIAVATRALETPATRQVLAGVLKAGPAVIMAAVLWLLDRMQKLKARKGKLAPMPPVSLFSLAGHGLDVFNRFNDLPTFYCELCQKYGKTFQVVVGPPLAPLDNVVVTTEPDCVKHILKENFDNYEKGQDMFDWMEESFGHGIFGVDGQAWYRQRKTASHIFTADNVRFEMVRTIINNCDLLAKTLRELSKGGTKPVEVQELFLTFTMETFCEIGFGVQPKCLSTDPPPEWVEFGKAFDGLQVMCASRMLRPHWKLQKPLAKLAVNNGWPVGSLCGPELAIAKYSKVVNATLDRIIEKRLKDGALTRGADTPAMVPVSSWGENLFQRTYTPDITVPTESNKTSPLPQSSPPATFKNPKGGNSGCSKYDSSKRIDLLELFLDVEPPMPASELRDAIKSLLAGGRDTTATSLTWASFELAKRPDIERKCREEVQNAPIEDPLELYRLSKKWKYIDAVVRETIRLHTPVPIDAKHAINDDVLPNGTFVGAGWITVYSPYVMARDTDLWGPDAATWRPERWFEGELSKMEPSPFVMTSFQAGPRSCLGKDLAIMEAKLVIGLLLRAGVTMRLWPSMSEETPKYQMGVTMKVADPGVQMKITFADASQS